MGAAPVAVGGQREHADDPAEPIIGPAAAEERAMAAIVLDHEEANEEACRRDGEQQRQPVADLQAPEHGEPEADEGQCGERQLEQRPVGLLLSIGARMRTQSLASRGSLGARAPVAGAERQGGHGGGRAACVAGHFRGHYGLRAWLGRTSANLGRGAPCRARTRALARRMAAHEHRNGTNVGLAAIDRHRFPGAADHIQLRPLIAIPETEGHGLLHEPHGIDMWCRHLIQWPGGKMPI